jgi:hypothetical protein
MWNVLTTAPSIESAYDTLLGEYQVDASELRRDLAEFVEDLSAQQLIDIGTSVA